MSGIVLASRIGRPRGGSACRTRTLQSFAGDIPQQLALIGRKRRPHAAVTEQQRIILRFAQCLRLMFMVLGRRPQVGP
jgi:hypothetical protein